jgi:hypothetical protein
MLQLLNGLGNGQDVDASSEHWWNRIRQQAKFFGYDRDVWFGNGVNQHSSDEEAYHMVPSSDLWQ